MKKYFISFILLFLFIPNVNAKVQTLTFSNMKFYDNNKEKSAIYRCSNTSNTCYDGLEMTSSKFTLTFDNDFSNFNEIGFELYNSLSEINSNPDYDAPIMPLVVLDGYPCSVTPIGIMDQDPPYYYNADEFALCSVKQKTGSHYIDIFTYKLPTVNSPFIGVHTFYVKGFTDDETIKDVIQQQEQTQQSITDGSNKINDSITSEEQPDIDLDLDETSNTPISDLILFPITLLNKLINTIGDNTCSSYTLPFFYDTSVTFPCFQLSNYLGTSITNSIDLFICLFMCYNLAMLFISIFEDITSLRDTYDSLYEPKHADTGYKPKHGKE